MNYQEHKFELPRLIDISPESLAIHLGLYGGYVKNFNATNAALQEFLKDPEKNTIAISELTRRLPFEFDGMRMHEYYFAQWEKEPTPFKQEGALASSLARQYGSVEAWLKRFEQVGLMRGIGWANLYFDPQAGEFHTVWVSDHELGHFAGLPVILALDMWEHAFLEQFGPAGKKAYIEACFKNYNWNVMEARFASASKK